MQMDRGEYLPCRLDMNHFCLDCLVWWTISWPIKPRAVPMWGPSQPSAVPLHADIVYTPLVLSRRTETVQTHPCNRKKCVTSSLCIDINTRSVYKIARVDFSYIDRDCWNQIYFKFTILCFKLCNTFISHSRSTSAIHSFHTSDTHL